MPRNPVLSCVSVAAIVLAGCGDDATLTQPEPGVEAASAAATPAPNSWTTRAPILTPHSEFVASAFSDPGGRWSVHIFGGGDEDGTHFSGEKYDVATDTWTSNGALVLAQSLNGSGRIGNRIYFTGGESCCDVDFRTFNTTWAYEPATATLFQRANTPKATKYGVTGAIGGKLYVLPGFCSGESVDPGHCDVGGPTRQLWRYDPSTNTWTTRRQAPHFHTLGAGAVIGDRLYVVGSSNQDAYLDVYDPATNTWQTRAPIPTPGERLFAAPLQGGLFVLSWTSGSPVVLKAFLYNPAKNTWKPRAAPPVAGPIVRINVDGKPRLFLPGLEASYLYTP